MKANIGFAIEYFAGTIVACVPTGLLFWFAEYLTKNGHDKVAIPLYIFGGIFGSMVFYLFCGCASALFLKVDMTDKTTTYYCPSCKASLGLGQMDFHKTFCCPHCGQLFHALGGLFRSKNVRCLSSKESYDYEKNV